MDKPALLIVDDEVIVLRALKRVITEHFTECDVVTAVDVVMATQAARELGPRLKVLITDQQLGLGRGTDLARSVRFNNPNVQVLIITGYLDRDILGDFDGLAKPYDVEELIVKVTSKLAPSIPD